jgi:hypothetical protein
MGGRIGDPDAVIPLQVPDDALRPHVIRTADVQDLVRDLCWRLVGVAVGNAPPAREPLVAELAISAPPEAEGRPRNPEVSTGLSHIPDLLGTLDDSFLAMGLPLLVSHSDLLDHLVS